MKNEINLELLSVDVKETLNAITDLDIDMACKNCNQTNPEKVNMAYGIVC